MSLNIDHVSVVYPAADGRAPVSALSEINLAIEEGEFVVALGASGCGKSTLLNLIAGFLSPSSGSLTLDGVTVQGPGADRAVVFQKHALLPWLNVIDNVAFGLQIQGVAKEARYKIANEFIGLLGLDGFQNSPVYKLSGGMQQRVGIARALANDPDVLLMDEPFAALDAQNRSLMQAEMGRLLAESDLSTRKTMVLVTHSIDEAILLSDRIVVLSSRPGRLKEEVVVDLPRPRDEDDPQFIALRHKLRLLINEERVAGD